MLQAFGLSFCPDPRGDALFENIDLAVHSGEKVALVGRNGVGKSVLLRILIGEYRSPTGRIVLGHGDRVAYLPQDFDLGFEGSLDELLERLASDAPQHAVARAMSRVGLDPAFLHRLYNTMSLGERMRGTLAALLASEPTILVLDEPTNHLDIDAKEWLENYLAGCPESVLFACHDRSIIDAVADRVVEIERGRMVSYTGGFAEMATQKQQTKARQQQAFEKHKDEDRRLRIAAEQALQSAAKVTKKPTQRTYDPKQKAFFAGKQAKMDQRAKAILSRVQQGRENAPDKPFDDADPSLVFPCRPLRSQEALCARHLAKAYGSKRLFDDLNLTLDRGSRVAIVGPNGAGKTTLFRILLEEEAPDKGEVIWAPDAQVATLSQARDLLDLDKPAIQALEPGDREKEQFARTCLARLGLIREMADRPLRVLSVGERTKVEIVSMILSGANVLVLDEPTNHLDIASVEALEAALESFPGAILFTSHDRAFVDRLATEVIVIS